MTLRDQHPDPAAAAGLSIDVQMLLGKPDGIWRVSPSDREVLLLPCSPGVHPGTEVRRWLEGHGLTPCFLHSTSWRYEQGVVVLTYAAVLEVPEQIPDGFVLRRVAARPLTSWGPVDPPVEIPIQEVVSHTLRHLAWLVQRDERAKEVLRDWVPFLAGYEPEPFRALDEARP